MTNWAEVSRADAAERGDCWYQVDDNYKVIDGWCEAHLRYETATPTGPEPRTDAAVGMHRRGVGLSSYLCSYCVEVWPCPTVEEATYGPGGFHGTDAAVGR